MLCDVRLEVTLDRLGYVSFVQIRISDWSTHPNVRRINFRRGPVIDQLIARKEGHCIIIALEGFDDLENVGKVIEVVGARRIVTINGNERCVYIKDHVDTGRVEDAGAFVVVRKRIEVVYSDRVDLRTESVSYVAIEAGKTPYTEFLQQRSIPDTSSSIAQHVRVGVGVKCG